MRYALIALALLLSLPIPAAAQARRNCDFDSARLTFGLYDVFSPFALASTGNISFACNNSTTVLVFVSRGSSHNVTLRTMTQSDNRLSVLYYNVYSDPGHTQIWSDGTGGSAPVIISTSGNRLLVLPVYGLIPALQDVTIGQYSDVLIVSLQF